MQKEALEHTKARLEETLDFCNYKLILDSHSHMERYLERESADCIMFNLGYLPGGDHKIATKAESTLQALGQGLELLKKDGVMSICIYSGGDSGFEEKDAVLAWLKNLDPGKYLVLVTQYYNRPNNPPIPAMVIRIR